MKIFKVLFSVLIITLLFTACSGEDGKEESLQTGAINVDEIISSSAAPVHSLVTFEVEGYGNFVVETYPEYAPETVKHFLSLVESGYYNGFSVDKINHSHSIVTSETSSIPSGDDTLSKPVSVAGEFSKNGKSNMLKLDKYTLALTHIDDSYNSGKAQFVIMLTSDHDLNGKCAGFAKVVQGTEIIDRIAGAQTDITGAPVSPIVMKKAYINS